VIWRNRPYMHCHYQTHDQNKQQVHLFTNNKLYNNRRTQQIYYSFCAISILHGAPSSVEPANCEHSSWSESWGCLSPTPPERKKTKKTRVGRSGGPNPKIYSSSKTHNFVRSLHKKI